MKQLDAIVVGAGFAGLYMLHKLRGAGLATRVLEAGDGVGGTWYWNRYPGARCDIPSLQYSYQFDEQLQQDWEWTEKYATQPEILRYAEHVTERFELRRDIQFNARVAAANYDADVASWRVELTDGEVLKGRYLIMATGCLSVPNYPEIKGLNDFNKPVYHTGKWPHDGVDFTDLRVGMIGTGSSAIQSAPLIAQQASSLTIFQRTPNYSVPAHNGPLDPKEVSALKARYAEYRAENWLRGFGADFRDNPDSAFALSDSERLAEYEKRWEAGGLAFLGAFGDLAFDDKANATAQEFIRGKIHQLVADPALAERLTPTTPVGCKRLCVDDDYYGTFNDPHVQLVDLRDEPITAIDAQGIITDAARYDLDALVLATGFDAMTGAVTQVDIRGADGAALADKWAHGPRAYLGLATAGFPNLFLITGPGSPSVLSNMLPSIEQHVEWIAECMSYLEAHQHRSIEAESDAEDAWLEHVNEVANSSIYVGCNSWYLGSNVAGKERVFMPYLGVPPYVEKCAEVASQGYTGFRLA